MGQLRVVTSCSSRFHIFDQARELSRAGLLHQLITDYPPARAADFGIPPERVRSLLLTGAVNYAVRKAHRHVPDSLGDRAMRALHAHFSRRLARVLPEDMGYFIGLSSFCREALAACRASGVRCAVDHGSVHQAEDARLVREEADRWGVPCPPDLSPDWVIAKEDEEFSLADDVFAVSTVARDSLIRQGIPADKIFVNPLGVDVSAFAPAPRRNGQFRVLQVGMISLRKGVLDTFEAFRRAAIPEAELWFVGVQSEPGLRSIVTGGGVPGVSFMPPVPQSDLPGIYTEASAFVLASLADGFGMVVPQAMACGVPVIVTENVGARDLVVDGVNGFVVPIRSPEAIAERLRFLADNPGAAAAMGAMAAQTVRQGYAWTDYGDRLAAFLRRVVP